MWLKLTSDAIGDLPKSIATSFLGDYFIPDEYVFGNMAGNILG